MDGKIYVVQSRPITTLFPLPTLSNEGEGEDALQVYFSFNAGENDDSFIYVLCVWVFTHMFSQISKIPHLSSSQQQFRE